MRKKFTAAQRTSLAKVDGRNKRQKRGEVGNVLFDIKELRQNKLLSLSSKRERRIIYS